MISFEIYVFRKSAYVVVGLDNSGFFQDRTQSHPGKSYPVRSNLLLPIFFASSSNTRMNSSPMILRLRSRIGYTCQLIVETLLCIDTDEVQLVIDRSVQILPLPRHLRFYEADRDRRIRRSAGRRSLSPSGRLLRKSLHRRTEPEGHDHFLLFTDFRWISLRTHPSSSHLHNGRHCIQSYAAS